MFFKKKKKKENEINDNYHLEEGLLNYKRSISGTELSLNQTKLSLNSFDDFSQECGYSWDLVLVFPLSNSNNNKSMNQHHHDSHSDNIYNDNNNNNENENNKNKKNFIKKLKIKNNLKKKKKFLRPDEIVERIHNAGLETFLFYSIQDDEIFCKVRASVDRLGKHADLINYKQLLDENKCKLTAEYGNEELNISPIYITHDPNITPIRPFQFLYGKYDTEPHLQSLYYCQPPLRHPFEAMDRIKLILSILQTKNKIGGSDLHLDVLKEVGSILAYYPLHSLYERDELKDIWLDKYSMPWNQPLDMIRPYFGEKIALYFCFLGHYTTWLIGLSIIGMMTFIDTVIEWNTNAYTVPYFCIFVSFWCVLMLEFWKRKESTMAMKWGMTDFEEEEENRPQFRGEEMTSFIDGKSILYYPPDQRRNKIIKSQSIILLLIIFVIAVVGSIFWLKYFLVDETSGFWSDNGSTIASLANALQIQVLNFIYSKIATYLTIKENHRTDTEFEDSLIGKLFMFQFVNSYASLYYIGFLKSYVEGECDNNDCMAELMLALGIIFVTRLISGNATEILVPKIKANLRERAEKKGTNKKDDGELSRPEIEFTMEEYDRMMGTLEDYAELSIQFGYLTLFVSSFPLAPLLALISNYVEIRTDAWKLLYIYRRPIPSGAEDIGTWQEILTVTACIAVITNAGLICFTMTLLDDWENDDRVWAFILFQYFVFLFMFIFAYCVDDIPYEVKVQLERQSFICSKLIDGLADENDEELANINKLQNSMDVHDRDDEL